MTERLRETRLVQALLAPCDGAALAVFRVTFGLIGFISALRFLSYGWVNELFVQPRFYFSYWGFSWLKPLGATGMHALFVALSVVSMLVAIGLVYRVAIVLFFLGFTYVQLLDVTNYLNHYYLVSLVSFLMCFMPLDRVWSLDGWLRRRYWADPDAGLLPAWCTWLLRFQVGLVYVFAGLAKLGSDWLLDAQPLNLWLSARTHLPLLGPLLGYHSMALFMSWAGFLFDTTVVLFLLHPRTRLLAFGVVLVFHTVTGALFPIGMFPVIMVSLVQVFFAPNWPRNMVAFLSRARPVPALADTSDTTALADASVATEPSSLSHRQRLAVALAALYCGLQILLPLRSHLYGGNVLWHEQGMRWSWRVMVREKNGSVSYRVVDQDTQRVYEISPNRFLTDRQLRDFSTQPDMILQLAHHIRDSFLAGGHQHVSVYADVLVSLNGRRAARLIDPHADLAVIEATLSSAPWILPAPEAHPIHLHAAESL